MVLRKAVAAAALWMLMCISCHAKLDSSGCPTSFQGVCVCGMGYSRYDRFQTKKFTVNCTNTGFTTADMLKDLPEETEVLIFNGNSVPILPFNILNFSNYDYLDIIDMSNNHIRFIQGRTFHRVYNVKTLILDHNDLEITDKQERPRIFSNFENLERLHLTNAFSEKINASDYLLSLEDIFYESKLSYLKILHLEQNEIWSIGDNAKVFCQLPALEQLLLGDNRLIDIDFQIDCLHSLRYIDLERNMIPRLSEDAINHLDAFSRMDTPLQIKLEENPFVCDCRSKEFFQWLKSTKVKVISNSTYKCVDGYPDSNIGKMLLDVHELKCPTSGNHHGYSSASIGVLSFLLVFTSSLLLAIAYFHRQKIKNTITPYWNFLTRKIGYTGIFNEETPQEVNV